MSKNYLFLALDVIQIILNIVLIVYLAKDLKKKG